MYKAGKVPDSEGSGRTQEGTVSIRRNLKLAAPSRSPGKRADGETEKAKGRALGNSSDKEREPPEENKAVTAPTSGTCSLEPSFPKPALARNPKKGLGRFLPSSACVPFSVSFFFFPSLFLHLISPSEGGLNEQRAPHTRAVPPQELLGWSRR